MQDAEIIISYSFYATQFSEVEKPLESSDSAESLAGLSSPWDHLCKSLKQTNQKKAMYQIFTIRGDFQSDGE